MSQAFKEILQIQPRVIVNERVVVNQSSSLLELRRGIWGDNYFLYLLAIVGALVMPLPVALALGTCVLVVIAYLWIAHQPFWLIYYLELFPVLALLSALGLWQFVTLVSELKRSIPSPPGP